MATIEIDFRNVTLKEAARGLSLDISRLRQFCEELNFEISLNKNGEEIISQTHMFGVQNELAARRRAGADEEAKQRSELGLSPDQAPSIY